MGSYSNVFHSFSGLGYARPDEPLACFSDWASTTPAHERMRIPTNLHNILALINYPPTLGKCPYRMLRVSPYWFATY